MKLPIPANCSSSTALRQDRVEWQSRAHFFAVGAQAMRRVLVDYARARNAQRRGGQEQHVPVDIAEDEISEIMTHRRCAAYTRSVRYPPL